MSAANPRRYAHRICLCLCAALISSLVPPAGAAENSRFVAGQFKTAQLRFVQELPVVTVEGTPEEMGEQLGMLLKQPLGELMRKKNDIAQGFGIRQPPDILVKLSRLLTPGFPAGQLHELEAMAKAADVDLDMLASANLMYEMSRFPACSTLAVEPARSATGGTLLGRNFDFPTFGFLDKYSVITVYRPQGKHAFASIAFPGIVGVFSGMNDAGLALAQLEVNSSADNSPRVMLRGTPVPMCFRRVLEECTTIDEAEKLLREQNRMMMCNLAVCDRQGAAVFEITPRTLVRRPADRGLSACTNHFRTRELARDTSCWRFDQLSHSQAFDKLGIKDVSKLLDSANQGRFTFQTMLFEPSTLCLHVSFGPAPSSAQPLKPIDLAKLFRPDVQPQPSPGP